jgi:CBS domain-containing protein
MKVQDIMTTNVECIPPDATIQEAAERMKSLDVGFLPVCEKDRLIGTVTDRDIVIRGVAENHDNKTTARKIMTSDVYYCFDGDDIEKCAEHMKDKDVRRMLVLDKNKRLVGVVSLGDISKAQEETAAETLKDITEAA